MSNLDNVRNVGPGPGAYADEMTKSNVANAVDPRIDDTLRASNAEVNEGYLHQLRDHLPPPHTLPNGNEKSKSCDSSAQESQVIYVEFEADDPRDPFNFTQRRKWVMTACVCLFASLSASAGSTYNQGFATMVPELHTTTYLAGVGLSTWCFGFGITPLITASLSEEFGRMPLYILSAAGFAVSHMMVALAPNITTVIMGRFLCGVFGSTGSTMAGGSIADIWVPRERGFYMSIYTICTIQALGVGATIAAYVETAPHMGWRWIQWIHCIVTASLALLIPVLMKESRSGVILTRLAKKKRAETGDQRIRARIEDERGSLPALVWVSCTRPIYLLFTEPVVIAFSLWIGLAWGLLNGVIDSIAPVFRDLHNFSTNAIGLAFLSLTVGAWLGFATSFYQERLYRQGHAKRGPEARLYLVCVAAITFPIGMFIYAWCAFPSVPWIGLCIGIVIFMWSVFTMYGGVFIFVAEVYGPFASSALAGQSLARNLAGTIFPLFILDLYHALGYPWGNTVFALLAVVLAPVPFVLFFFGPKLRAKSKFASAVRH